jgi:hypothetical protein
MENEYKASIMFANNNSICNVPWIEMERKAVSLNGQVKGDIFTFTNNFNMWTFHEWYRRRLREINDNPTA